MPQSRPGFRWSLALAGLTALIAFVFRVLTLHGLPNDHFMHLAWAQQLLAGELPGRDFVEPGMPLMILASAAVQYLWNVPFSEVILTAALLGIAAGATYWVTERLTSSRVAGVAAAMLGTALQPRLYSYPKILLPAVLLLLLYRYTQKPSRAGLAALAIWTAAAVLLRHDLGADVFIVITIVLLLFHWPDRRTIAASVSRYAVILAFVLLPYFVAVQRIQGWGEHLREGYEFSKSEVLETVYAPEEFPFFESQGGSIRQWDRRDSAALLFYVLQAAPILLVILLFIRRSRHTKAHITVVLAAVVMLILYRLVILRHPLVGRLADLSSLFAIVGVLCVTELLEAAKWIFPRRPVVAAMLASATWLFVAVTCASVWVLGNLGESLRDTHLLDGRMADRWVDVARAGTVWPWPSYWPAGSLPPAIQYLHECTRPTDRLLVTWPATEYYYFARRPFGAGHALFLWPNAFTTTRDQRRMLERLEGQRVPVALMNENTYRQFARAYPMLDEYLRTYYVPVGSFKIYDDSMISVAVRRDLKGTRGYGADAWPCGFRDEGNAGAGELRD
jgi:hypothetical protein